MTPISMLPTPPPSDELQYHPVPDCCSGDTSTTSTALPIRQKAPQQSQVAERVNVSKGIKQWLRHYFIDNPPEKALKCRNLQLTFNLSCRLSLQELLELQKVATSYELQAPFYQPLVINYSQTSSTTTSRVTVTMPSLEHEITASEVQYAIRDQLWDGGNFYWGDWAAEGKRAVQALNASQVGKKIYPTDTTRFRYPDGSLWIRKLQPERPFFVIEVSLGHNYKTGYRKCQEWLRCYKGKVRYAVLVKIHQWPEKKKKEDFQEETVAVAAAGKRKASLLEEAEKVVATKRSKSTDIASELEELEVEYDYEEIAEDAYEASDTELENEEDEEVARRRKYKFKSVEVSVFMVDTTKSVIKVIDRMEVWPTMSEYTWEFAWSDMYSNSNNDKADLINTISFDFLNQLFESDDMLRNPTVYRHE
ncbi:hypothetical protein K440DRAFT_631170 [Wilcoxina mikolae CBS 423.85]|nr:hypothetical protein K440DRAFT_631170 [Wilcoxina mikolae CBS 423.85]